MAQMEPIQGRNGDADVRTTDTEDGEDGTLEEEAHMVYTLSRVK